MRRTGWIALCLAGLMMWVGLATSQVIKIARDATGWWDGAFLVFAILMSLVEAAAVLIVTRVPKEV